MSIIFQAKKSRFGDAVSSQYLNVMMHDLQDLVNSRPEVVVPTSDSVWLELPYRDVPNRNVFYPAVTALLKQCKYYHVPFVLFYTPRDSVEWTAFKRKLTICLFIYHVVVSILNYLTLRTSISNVVFIMLMPKDFFLQVNALFSESAS